jgi:type I restriction enzyme R subunit
VTTLDLRWFENVFVEFGFGTHQDIELIATEHEGLGIYLRSLTGLDREAASAALDRFQQGTTLNANQLHFLNMLTDVLAKNGLVDVGQLYEVPFTALASGGPEDLFPEAEVDAIVTALRDVRSTAIPVAEAI